MLGQPVYFLTPDVVGVHLTGALREGVTATDLVLHITEMLRKAKVVGKFVEFHGEGAASLSRHRPRDDRQHGARVRRDDGLLPGRRGDAAATCARPGRTDGAGRGVPQLLQGAGAVRHPAAAARSTTATLLELDLADGRARASPGRSARRIASTCRTSRAKFRELLQKPVTRERLQQAAERARQARRDRDRHRRRAEPSSRWPAAASRTRTTRARSGAPRRARRTPTRHRDRDDEQPPDAGPRRRTCPPRSSRRRASSSATATW